MSHESANSFPPPYAAPFIAATTGLPTPDNFLKTFCPNSITANTSFGSVNCANDFMSAPAQNALFPPPVNTIPTISLLSDTSSITLSNCSKTDELRAFTGGLSTVTIPILSSILTLTNSFSAI